MDDEKKHTDTVTVNGPDAITQLAASQFNWADANVAPVPGIVAQDITQLDSSFNTIDLGNITIGAVGSAGNYSYPYTLSTAWGTDTITASGISTTINQGGTLELQGENADIIVNGQSLMGKLEAISERLNLLEVNPKLEAEWDQLKELGEQYRQLEQELKAKSAMWKVLKTKTPGKLRS